MKEWPTAETAIASNKKETVTISMIGEALGCHWLGKTVVRPTTCGRFAVLHSTPKKSGGYRLIKTFADPLHARRYNFAIHGEQLGE